MNAVKAFIFRPRRRVGGKVRIGSCFHLSYRLPGEDRYRTRSLGVHDRTVAEEKRREFLREQEAEAVGITEPKALRASAQKRMSEHLADFIADLEARGKDDMYTYNMAKRIGLLIRDCGWEYPKHVTPDSFLAWRVAHKDKAAKTLNDYLASASALLNWMERHGKLKANPLRSVAKVESRGKEKRVRRALSDDQMRRLVAVSGPRALAYLLAAHTGLRRSELEALQWEDVVLDTPRPFLRVRASTTKNHMAATIFLHEDVVALLRAVETPCGAVLDRCPSIAELKADLQAAGVPYVDAQGRVADFHALRHTLATNMAKAGVPRRIAMEVMRHCDSRLTDKNYTDVSQLHTAGVMDALPSFLSTHTEKHTEKFVSGCPAVSKGVQAAARREVQETALNTGESQSLSTSVPICQGEEVGSLARTRT